MEKAYLLLHDSAAQMASCGRTWHFDAVGSIRDPRYYAGADQLVRRKVITIQRGQPPYLRSNIAVVGIPVGRQTLYFFPDRVLVFDADGVGAINYRDLEIQIVQGKLIELESVPHDATVVEYTWRYVNKRGGPDKRFRNNRQLPVCLYEELWLKSQSGLNKVIQCSRLGVCDGFAQAIGILANLVKV